MQKKTSLLVDTTSCELRLDTSDARKMINQNFHQQQFIILSREVNRSKISIQNLKLFIRESHINFLALFTFSYAQLTDIVNVLVTLQLFTIYAVSMFR